jgi:hypothetical protein
MTTDPTSHADASTHPSTAPPAPDLVAIEALIRRAIDERRPDLLSIIGHGEVSIAIRWATGDIDCVVKRVPPFPNRIAADQYTELIREYLADLGRIGVRCVSTDLYSLDREDGTTVVYHCQPLLNSERLADHVLRQQEPSASHPLLVAVLDDIVRVHSAGLPIDGQFANWYWLDGEPWQLDFSTPFLQDEKGDIRFDVTGFTLEYPAPVRSIVYKELMKIIANYRDIVWTLEDLMNQLVREGLDSWCEPFAEAALARHELVISPTLARERSAADAKFWPNLLRLKRLQRAWMQRTRRRYDSLLPAASTYKS